MKNLDIPHRFLKFGEFQDKGHNEKDIDARQITRIKTFEKIIYLTFDMCPSSVLDEDIINWLVANKYEATFFICVDWLWKNKDKDLSFIDNPLFTIGGHGFHHVDTLKQSNDEQSADISLACNFWQDRGNEIKWYRVPYGHPTETTFTELNRRGIKCASWSGPVFDRVATGLKIKPNELARNYIDNNMRRGDLWVMHANGEGIDTFNILKEFTEAIYAKGFEYRKL